MHAGFTNPSALDSDLSSSQTRLCSDALGTQPHTLWERTDPVLIHAPHPTPSRNQQLYAASVNVHVYRLHISGNGNDQFGNCHGMFVLLCGCRFFQVSSEVLVPNWPYGSWDWISVLGWHPCFFELVANKMFDAGFRLFTCHYIVDVFHHNGIWASVSWIECF